VGAAGRSADARRGLRARAAGPGSGRGGDRRRGALRRGLRAPRTGLVSPIRLIPTPGGSCPDRFSAHLADGKIPASTPAIPRRLCTTNRPLRLTSRSAGPRSHPPVPRRTPLPRIPREGKLKKIEVAGPPQIRLPDGLGERARGSEPSVAADPIQRVSAREGRRRHGQGGCSRKVRWSRGRVPPDGGTYMARGRRPEEHIIGSVLSTRKKRGRSPPPSPW
jgi:hypothetical protein